MPRHKESLIARILIGVSGLAIAAAVISGATLVSRHALPPERSTDGPDFDPILASAICTSGRAAPPLPARQGDTFAVSRRISDAR
ncbi:hypothetical protein SOM61_10875 [Massilia sp. CFBP9012]|uniref:hypothetical protein n=1 Tax=Massilia sp. CFBP9012 TaxID=3096531 RepID=UPI002A69A6E2|nr:hypothetical protein [Massilia sp. CFBP9012]MDY0975471.1 hypothetical protein [Massilia sp. CFBP9012]